MYIAEADGIPDYKCANSSTQKRLVALKFLMKNATEKEKYFLFLTFLVAGYNRLQALL